MAMGLMLATVAVSDGREDDYRAWHDAHIRELVAHVPGVVSAQRFELADAGALAGAFPTARFIAAYTIADDPAQVLADLAAARSQGLVSPPPDGVVAGGLTLSYRAAGEPVA